MRLTKLTSLTFKNSRERQISDGLTDNPGDYSIERLTCVTGKKEQHRLVYVPVLTFIEFVMTAAVVYSTFFI
ncbi:hypothetical protein K503DRAFT_774083 [Rhizopogon vinicolor AM-OR11-026]|uniref:Uncharacterized protein n=1 Tax=Rhizopogon vinicolor AM-OR11-026 TaxID=1314800 RepID=A0A1B7MQG9_9AGAM|nr:hypothetical protein K503DRAFT_774083 [Rhizopogon vinicolor AM-OR11-026]